MKKLLIIFLAFGSTLAFAQNYGGSTYYGYGTISMGSESPTQTRENSLPRQTGEKRQTLKVFYFPFTSVDQVTEVENNICVSGKVKYGNASTQSSNDFKLDFDRCFHGYDRDIVDIKVSAGSQWSLERGQDPTVRFNSVQLVNDKWVPIHIQENVQSKRCVDIKSIKQAMKKSKCATDRVSINGIEVFLH
jgi:hypothetical protein